ncbi:hypothetical protein ACLB90_15990 [Stenotrophomonas sp. LGBM10]|uniref:hypothetical protein n=1 Tax=Stenotrophomonas sp. LGBM10 TaxID=3390038 RepID=UPI00398B827B
MHHPAPTRASALHVAAPASALVLALGVVVMAVVNWPEVPAPPGPVMPRVEAARLGPRIARVLEPPLQSRVTSGPPGQVDTPLRALGGLLSDDTAFHAVVDDWQRLSEGAERRAVMQLHHGLDSYFATLLPPLSLHSLACDTSLCLAGLSGPHRTQDLLARQLMAIEQEGRAPLQAVHVHELPTPSDTGSRQFRLALARAAVPGGTAASP